MGQYWKLVNIDKREWVSPFRLGSSLKLWEHLAQCEGYGRALTVLLSAQVESRGGGDLDIDQNWHGPERTFPAHNSSPGPMPPEYANIARSVIGRWIGDRVLIVGDYQEDDDAKHFKVDPGPIPWSELYGKCHSNEDDPERFRDISELVATVIEHELGGKFMRHPGSKIHKWMEKSQIEQKQGGVK